MRAAARSTAQGCTCSCGVASLVYFHDSTVNVIAFCTYLPEGAGGPWVGAAARASRTDRRDRVLQKNRLMCCTVYMTAIFGAENNFFFHACSLKVNITNPGHGAITGKKKNLPAVKK